MYNEIMVIFCLRNNFCLNGKDVFLMQSEPLLSAMGLSRSLAGTETTVPLSLGRAFMLAAHAPPLQGGAVFYHTRAGTFPASQQCSPMAKRTEKLSHNSEKQPQPASAFQSHGSTFPPAEMQRCVAPARLNSVL